VLTGSVLPYWDKIEKVVGYQSVGSESNSRLKSKMRIVRVRVEKEGGEEIRLVGVEVSTYGLEKLEKLLGGDGGGGGGGGSSSDAKAESKESKESMKKVKGLDVGDSVIIVGLQKAKQYNGTRARVSNWDSSNGRWVVVFGKMEQDRLLVKGDNLHRL